MEIIIKLTIDGVDEKDVKVTTETKQKPNEGCGTKPIASPYARFFDESCLGWTKNSEYNLMYLTTQQKYCNDLLRNKGHLFLNEVYDILDMPRTSAGQVVGWIYDKEHPVGDNFVDFGLYDVTDESKVKFVNGYTSTVLLDFNVDGNILDLLEE